MAINTGITYVTYTEEQVRQLLEESVRQSGGHKRWIYDHKIDVSLPALRDILAHKSHVTNSTVLKALKLKRLVLYVEDDEVST